MKPVRWATGGRYSLSLIAVGYTVSALCVQEDDMQVSKWGNSLALRLPAAVVEASRLKEGDDIEIHVIGACTIGVGKEPSAKELLARLRKSRGTLPAGSKFERLEANERP